MEEPIHQFNKTLARLKCRGPDGDLVEVLACRYFATFKTPRGLRTYPGAKQWRLASTNALLTLIDEATFFNPETDEMLFLVD